MKEFKKDEFNQDQLTEYRIGMEQGVDVSLYMKPNICGAAMMEYRTMLVDGMSEERISKIINNKISDPNVLRELRLASSKGIWDDVFINWDHAAEGISELVRCMECGIDIRKYFLYDPDIKPDAIKIYREAILSGIDISDILSLYRNIESRRLRKLIDMKKRHVKLDKDIITSHSIYPIFLLECYITESLYHSKIKKDLARIEKDDRFKPSEINNIKRFYQDGGDISKVIYDRATGEIVPKRSSFEIIAGIETYGIDISPYLNYDHSSTYANLIKSLIKRGKDITFLTQNQKPSDVNLSDDKCSAIERYIISGADTKKIRNLISAPITDHNFTFYLMILQYGGNIDIYKSSNISRKTQEVLFDIYQDYNTISSDQIIIKERIRKIEYFITILPNLLSSPNILQLVSRCVINNLPFDRLINTVLEKHLKYPGISKEVFHHIITYAIMLQNTSTNHSEFIKYRDSIINIRFSDLVEFIAKFNILEVNHLMNALLDFMVAGYDYSKVLDSYDLVTAYETMRLVLKKNDSDILLLSKYPVKVLSLLEFSNNLVSTKEFYELFSELVNNSNGDIDNAIRLMKEKMNIIRTNKYRSTFSKEQIEIIESNTPYRVGYDEVYKDIRLDDGTFDTIPFMDADLSVEQLKELIVDYDNGIRRYEWEQYLSTMSVPGMKYAKIVSEVLSNIIQYKDIRNKSDNDIINNMEELKSIISKGDNEIIGYLDMKMFNVLDTIDEEFTIEEANQALPKCQYKIGEYLPIEAVFDINIDEYENIGCDLIHKIFFLKSDAEWLEGESKHVYILRSRSDKFDCDNQFVVFCPTLNMYLVDEQFKVLNAHGMRMEDIDKYNEIRFKYDEKKVVENDYE